MDNNNTCVPGSRFNRVIMVIVGSTTTSAAVAIIIIIIAATTVTIPATAWTRFPRVFCVRYSTSNKVTSYFFLGIKTVV